MSILRVTFSSIIFLAFASTAGAAEEPHSFFEKFHSVKGVSIQKVGQETLAQPNDAFGDCSEINTQPLKGSNLDLTSIVNIGKQLWKIIKKNQPTVNVNTDSANGLPKGADCWEQLESWNLPEKHSYQVTYTNYLGMDMVDFQFDLIYLHGGNIDGVGQYLANVKVVPASIQVGWGYNLNVNASVPSVVNVGTLDDPEAGVMVDLNWQVETVLKEEHRTMSFFVRGNGKLQEIN